MLLCFKNRGSKKVLLSYCHESACEPFGCKLSGGERDRNTKVAREVQIAVHRGRWGQDGPEERRYTMGEENELRGENYYRGNYIFRVPERNVGRSNYVFLFYDVNEYSCNFCGCFFPNVMETITVFFFRSLMVSCDMLTFL